MTHMHSAWVSREEYRLCEHTPEKMWQAASLLNSKIHCPNISLETVFILISVLCLVSSIVVYLLHICFFNGITSTLIVRAYSCVFISSKLSQNLLFIKYLFFQKVAFIFVCGVFLIIAGILYIQSAVMIANLPRPHIMPIITNIGKVFIAAFRGGYSEGFQLNVPSHHETFYHEKLITASLTIINGTLHVLCSWLSILDYRHSRAK